MAALYVYAIVDRPELALPAVCGFGGAAIGGVCAGDLMAVVSPLDGGAVALSRGNLLCHEGVIEALMGARAVLPARFGTTAEGEGRLRGELEARGAGLRANLERVRGRVEIAVRVGWQQAAEEPPARPRARPGDGRGYIQALLEQSQRSQRRRDAAEELAAELTAGLADLADAAVERVLPAPELLLKAAYLVRREVLAEMRRRIAGLRDGHPDLAILATGPWPAYSFIEEGNMA